MTPRKSRRNGPPLLMLVAGTLIIRKQLDYIRTADVGYDRKNVLALRLWEADGRTRYREIETELLRNPDIRAAAVSNVAPVRATEMNNFMVESDSGEMVEVPQVTNYFVDSGYFDLFGLTFVAGRGFPPDAVGDLRNQAVINETAAAVPPPARAGWLAVREDVGPPHASSPSLSCASPG